MAERGTRHDIERAPRGPSLFRQRDLKAAIRAARAAGETAFAVEVAPDGCLRVIVRTEAAEAATAGGGNPWDEDAKG